MPLASPSASPLSASPQSTYDDLSHLEQADTATSARYRQTAIDILADQNISLNWREQIADRLNEADQLLGMLAVGDRDDSY
jgi:hypothetical protein